MFQRIPVRKDCMSKAQILVRPVSPWENRERDNSRSINQSGPNSEIFPHAPPKYLQEQSRALNLVQNAMKVARMAYEGNFTMLEEHEQERTTHNPAALTVPAPVEDLELEDEEVERLLREGLPPLFVETDPPELRKLMKKTERVWTLVVDRDPTWRAERDALFIYYKNLIKTKEGVP
ncbi:hypothetical protein QAD02_021035 [Eretmocerus hayati]|uniref:Uncharacterized protein n=1 Tax=Eretmocerus hayati TaxID=131215 RepID=A0ACC2PSB3_9HYME|nr:hypothetical protein QAD02_021035 [Eretmocerus hayati]